MKEILISRLKDIRSEIESLSMYTDEIDFQILKAKRDLLIELIEEVDFELQLAVDQLNREADVMGI